MIAWLVLKTGLGRRAVVIGLGAALLLLAIGTLRLWLALHDQALVERHEAKSAARTSEKIVTAERAANSGDARRTVRDRARSREIEKEIEDAIAHHPEAAARPVGPAVAAVLDELRRQGAGEDRSSARGAD